MFDAEAVKTVLLYVPISIIGIWRWSFWVIRRTAAAMYRPRPGVWPADKPRPTVTIVTPVYNEDPAFFERAIQSWIGNGADEIIAVIDKTNTRHIVDFERRYITSKKYKTKFKIIVQPTKGKRAGLCDGIAKASGDLIALVDSDTIWSHDVLEKSIPYFKNPQIGGATLTQRVQDPDNAVTVIFDMMLWSRYQEEVPALLGVGKAFNTLSGRTAIYRREALLNDRYDNMHNLRHEFFLKTRSISGDDKRLTHLILEQGWHVAYVVGPKVFTSGMRSLKQFMKQRLRWTRNSWRGDLRAVTRGWIWRHPALAIFRIDSFVQPFVMLVGPVVFVFSLVSGDFLFAGILITWWIFSRCIKLFGYFRAHPKRIVYLPAYIVYSYANAALKIYALATLTEHSWATRWHKSRATAKKVFRKSLTIASGGAAVIVFFTGVTSFVIYSRNQSAAGIAIPTPVETQAFANDIDFASDAPVVPKIPENIILPTGVQTYVVVQGDTLDELSRRFGMDLKQLRQINGITSAKLLRAGQTIVYYQKGL